MNRTPPISGIISTIFLFLCWHLCAVLIDAPFIVPYPATVLSDIYTLVGESGFTVMLRATVLRGLASFSISIILSFLVGIPAGLSIRFESAIRPWMAVIRATPVVSLILLALFWFGSSFVPVFVSVLMTMPVMTESIQRGIRNTDPNLIVMSRVYRLTPLRRLVYIRIPSLLPYFSSGAGSSLGLTWKVVIAGEILAFPGFGIGTAMQTAKIHLETGRVFSLTIIAVILCLITEKVFSILTNAMSVRITGGDLT